MRKFNFLKIKHLRQNDKQPNANFLFDTNFLNAKIVGLFYPGNQNRQWLFGIYDTKKNVLTDFILVRKDMEIL